MDLQQIIWQGVDWIYMVQDIDKWWAAVDLVKNLQVL
jgi:hypothetical protein